jgi:hypothetical protein
MEGEAPQFSPLRPPSRRRRALTLLIGPVLWLAGLVVLSFVVRHRDSVEIAVFVTALSFLVWMFVLLPMRARRSREEGP